jgi:lipopolysaccharide export system permease protein
MRVSRTLFRYVLREVAVHALLGFLLFATLLVAQNFLRRLDELLAVGLEPRDLLGVIGCLFPMLAAYAIPIAFLFGVMAGIGRLAGDAEVTAMAACGLGLRSLLLPVLSLGVLVSAATAVLLIEVEPAARLRLRRVLEDVAARGEMLRPGQFVNLAGRVVYVQRRDEGNRLSGVLVADRSNPERPFVIAAETGWFHFDRDRQEIVLELERGDLHLDPRPRDDLEHRRIAFEAFRYAVDATPILEKERVLKAAEMSLRELGQHLADAESGTLPPEARELDPNVYRVHIQRRLALPLAPLVLALLGVPLALRPTRGARSSGTLLCIALLVAYYTLLTVGVFLATNGWLPAAPALWIPNLAFLAAALPLLGRARRGRP